MTFRDRVIIALLWTIAESNCRHYDFQSYALATTSTTSHTATSDAAAN
jgi:hypothetical protein